MHDNPNTGVWYHGSPDQIDILQPGSTITQNRRLAEVFSHKPTIVSAEDDGRIRHNGTLPGLLYRIAENVRPEDVTPHPRTTMQEGEEWLTLRELSLTLLGPTPIFPENVLTSEDIEKLQQQECDHTKETSELPRPDILQSLLEKQNLCLSDLQTFHQHLDREKQFDTDLLRNSAYLTEEVGEVIHAIRKFRQAHNSLNAQAARAHLGEELADCLAYILTLANYAEINLQEAYCDKMLRNLQRTW